MSNTNIKNDRQVKNLKHLRESKGYSLRELAKELDSDYTAISYWERGIKTPNFENLKKLEKFFGKTGEEILSNDEHYSAPPVKYKEKED